MQRELLTLFSRIALPAGGSGETAQRLVAAFNGEVASLGYSFNGEAMAALGALDRATFDTARTEVLALLAEVSGADANHAALFTRFPYDTPDQARYLRDRIMGHWSQMLGRPVTQGRLLSCGHVIDTTVFDMSRFGACPICQAQVEGVRPADEARHPLASLTPLKIVGLADDGFIQEQANVLLARQSSLSAAERRFVAAAIDRVALDLPVKLFRESLPLVYLAAGDDLDAVRRRMVGATDILRIAVFLSDVAGDLSLKAPVRFRLATRHKKRLLSLLDGLVAPEEDMLRHRERWLRLGEALNPASAVNARRYPQAARAFDRIRNAPAAVVTFNRQVEAAMRARTVDAALLGQLAARPGEFMRRLDFLLRTTEDPLAVLDTLRGCAGAVTTPMLFSMIKYLESRREPGIERAFFPKGQTNKVFVTDERRPAIPDTSLTAASAILEAELHRRLAQSPPLGRVFVDPALSNHVAAFNRRGDSDSATPMTKGSKYPLGDAPVIRLFVHWTGMVDVDLSIVCLDERLRFVSQISFTNTEDYGCVHSGDIQRAPDGASEFIDFEIGKLRSRGVRYVVASVICFSGMAFGGFPCFAGFMERDALTSGRKYEPETVRLKFNLSTPSTSHLPVIFDLERMQVIFADLASASRSFDRAANGMKKLAGATRVVLNLPRTRPTAYDILSAHAQARGTLVYDRDKADQVFDAVPADLDGWLEGAGRQAL